MTSYTLKYTDTCYDIVRRKPRKRKYTSQLHIFERPQGAHFAVEMEDSDICISYMSGFTNALVVFQHPNGEVTSEMMWGDEAMEGAFGLWLEWIPDAIRRKVMSKLCTHHNIKEEKAA